MFKWPTAVVLATILYGGQYVGLSYQSRAERDRLAVHEAEIEKKITSLQEQLDRCSTVQQFLVSQIDDLQRQLSKQDKHTVVAPDTTRVIPQPPGP